MYTIRSTKKLDQGARANPTTRGKRAKFTTTIRCVLEYTGCSGQCVLDRELRRSRLFALVAKFVGAGDPRILSLTLLRLQEGSLQWCNSPFPEEGGTVYAEHKQTSYSSRTKGIVVH